MKRGLFLAAAGSSSSSMCWATPQGWMLLVAQGHDDTDDDDTAVSSACLWNPLTGDKLPLPDITDRGGAQVPTDLQVPALPQGPNTPWLRRRALPSFHARLVVLPGHHRQRRRRQDQYSLELEALLI